ncbi:hypothetical protein FG386_002789 [Cryptosporidium ryanae]|uniref:uncharacterized protein n=1 Tax=Cryptosporidium ryanae TaxID=515981 RepID=UPI00351A5F75|nr:hypothetical protein FG386_002789 [Cryptosporidium ryanae]
MSISDICSQLRRPGLQLPELCSLINSLGDLLVREIAEENVDELSVKMGWSQLVEILMQTTNQTVRHMAFENVQHFLISKNYLVFELNELYEDICNGIMKLLSHLNTEVQLEALYIIFEDYEYNKKKLKEKIKDKTLLSILLNGNVELVARLLTLITHYDSCDQRFILRKLLYSLRLGILGVKKREVVFEIIDRLCLLEKNIDLNEKNIIDEFSDCEYEFSKPYFLLLIFQVFENIPNVFDDMKIACYMMIKDEISILLCKESLNSTNFNFYFELIEKSINIMRNIYINHVILFYDFIEWLRTSYNLLLSYLKVNNINHINLNTILKLINPFVVLISELQYKGSQLLFIWESELKLPFKIDNNEISSRNLTIFNIDQIIESLIEFITSHTKNDEESKFLSLNYSPMLEYISNNLVIINLGLILDNFCLNFLKNKRNIIFGLAYHLNNYISEIQSVTDFESKMNNKYEFESYFIINYVLSKVYFIIYNHISNSIIKEEKDIFFNCIDKHGRFLKLREIDFLENDLFQTVLKFFNRIILLLNNSGGFSLSSYFSIYNSNRLRIIYYEVVSRYNTSIIPNNNNVILVILNRLYRFSNASNKINDYLFDINRIIVGDLDSISDKMFSNTLFTHIILSNRDIWVNNKHKIQDIFLTNISKLKIMDRYKYGGVFCINGHFKLAKMLFENIKLVNIESSVWIDTLVKLSSLYDIFDKMNRFIYQGNNEKKLEYKKLVYESKSLIEILNSNVILINSFVLNVTNTFFISLYMSILTKILGFMLFYLKNIEEQNNNIDKDVSEKIQQLFKKKNRVYGACGLNTFVEIKRQTIIQISEILKSLFGLINIAKFICKKSTRILINLYCVLKIILINNLILLIEFQHLKTNPRNINMLKSYFLLIFEKTKNALHPDSEGVLVKAEKTELKQEENEIKGKTPFITINKSKFNLIIEKSFLDNICLEKEIIESEVDWEIVKKIVKTETDNINLYIRETGSRDILLDIEKSYQDRFVYITYTYFKRSNWSYNEDYIKIEKVKNHNIFKEDINIKNKASLGSNDEILECMKIIKYLNKFPPLLLTIRNIAAIELKYELKGNVRKEIDNSEINVIPTLKLEGSLKCGFSFNVEKYWKWARIKVNYILDNEDEMVSNCYLDISVEKGSFSWTQPIESVLNVKQLRITSIPMTYSKLNIGTPTINIVPIL